MYSDEVSAHWRRVHRQQTGALVREIAGVFLYLGLWVLFLMAAFRQDWNAAAVIFGSAWFMRNMPEMAKS
jgi:hypothetical protein